MRIRRAFFGGKSLRLCEGRGEVQFGLPHDSCPTGGWREDPADFDGGMHLRCTTPAPKPGGFGLRLRAKRNQRQAKPATNFVVKCKLATRSSAAQPGAGAKTRLRKRRNACSPVKPKSLPAKRLKALHNRSVPFRTATDRLTRLPACVPADASSRSNC